MSYLPIAEELGRSGICVRENFITGDFAHEIREDLFALRDQELFKAAGIGQGNQNQISGSVRNNELVWLDRNQKNPLQEKLWIMLDQLQQDLNRSLFLGLVSFEGHYTSYPCGGFYERHLDAFSQDQKRTVSFILYLNEDWVPADGGMLRIYREDASLDVAPQSGTLACFLSRELEHEVLPNFKTRLSFTGWFKTS